MKALDCVVEAPGDWHTGLKMLTSIYNLYYHGFLEQFQCLLRWNRINKDVRSYYYQSTRLVSFVSEELNHFFMQDLVANRKETSSNASDVQYLCNAAEDYMDYMEAKRNSDDKWIVTCANFLQMSLITSSLLRLTGLEIPLLLNMDIKSTT